MGELTASSLSTTWMIPFFHMMREEMIAIGSMNRIRKPIIPNREPPLVMRTIRAKTVTIMITGMTPFTPPFTTFLSGTGIAKKSKSQRTKQRRNQIVGSCFYTGQFKNRTNPGTEQSCQSKNEDGHDGTDCNGNGRNSISGWGVGLFFCKLQLKASDIPTGI